MQINIKGGSKSQKKHAKSMVEFCVKKMMPRMRNLEFNLHLKNFGRDDSWGYCIQMSTVLDNLISKLTNKQDLEEY
jgi:hypothetical protein